MASPKQRELIQKRHQSIRYLARKEGEITVGIICRALHITEKTAREDLNFLTRQKKLEKFATREGYSFSFKK